MGTTMNAFNQSMDRHSIRPTHHMALPVTLLASDNTYLKYPARGVLQITEQSTRLGIMQAAFYSMTETGGFGAPVVVKNPVFSYGAAP
jgi:hypothetical protein